jgi:hypothetical protein
MEVMGVFMSKKTTKQNTLCPAFLNKRRGALRYLKSTRTPPFSVAGLRQGLHHLQISLPKGVSDIVVFRRL